MDAHVAHEGAELVEADLAVVVLVGELDRLVDDLLQLCILQTYMLKITKNVI